MAAVNEDVEGEVQLAGSLDKWRQISITAADITAPATSAAKSNSNIACTRKEGG